MTPSTTAGVYTVTGSVATVNADLASASFKPTAGQANTTSTTTFSITDTSSVGGAATTADTTPSVIDTDPAVATPQPTPTPAPDAVSINPAVTYKGDIFTLTGTASSVAGVTSVEISAVLNDGSRQDLGAATLNGDGTFTFADRIGANQQGFIEATETDGAGVQTVSADPGFSLTGGLDQGQFRARQTSYTDGGATETAVSLFRASGSRQVDVQVGNQTLTSDLFDTFNNHGAPSNTFVFDAGHGLDIVRQFRVDRTDHDTLSFQGSDFGNSIAEVLRNTTMVNGSAVITDPTSRDTVKLVGITKAELKANQRDFTFHA